MADKTIPDLQLISAVTAGVNFPADDSLQTYRATAAQIKAYILANENVLLAMLKNDIFTGLTEVSPADDDFFPLVDTSASNLTKKGSVGFLKRAAYRSVVTTDAVGVSDETMKLSGASFTSTLPTAVGVAGKRYKYIHAGTNFSQVYTIATTSGQTVGGIASGSYSLYTNGEVLEIESDGANWQIVGRVTDAIFTFGATTVTGTGSNPTKATNVVVDRSFGIRRGRNFRWQIEYAQTGTGGANGTGDYLYNLPSGITFDTSLFTLETGATSAAFGQHLGSFNALGNTANIWHGAAIPYDSSKFRIGTVVAVAAAGTIWGQAIANFGATTAMKYGGFIEFPVAGWRP